MRRICPVLLTFVVILFISGTAFSASEGTIVIAQGVDPGTLDPQDHYETPAFNVLLNIYETLVVRDDEMKLMPLLATSWRLINDTTGEFALPKGVKFQNGEDFNAAAVKFSLERIADGKNKLKQTTLVGIINRVEVIDDHTVRVITDPSPIPTSTPNSATSEPSCPPNTLRKKGRRTSPAIPSGQDRINS